MVGGVSTRLRASYVIAADGGSSPTRSRLGIGFEGRTYEDRWVVIDTKVLREWSDVDRLRFHCNPARPAVDCPTPLGHHRWEFPVLPGDDEAELVTEGAVRRLLADQGIGPDHVEVLRVALRPAGAPAGGWDGQPCAKPGAGLLGDQGCRVEVSHGGCSLRGRSAGAARVVPARHARCRR
ncbi:FAD-dependent monooxygenase [Janibacter hoylei]|uniref:FAD-dependent monooxygenase n=1 Tax=Janibacter hoylei TaxID=364298 RepID=UPI0027B9A610|nr:FAD-dependent monooxygenase [Janibacter hoylei]